MLNDDQKGLVGKWAGLYRIEKAMLMLMLMLMLMVMLMLMLMLMLMVMVMVLRAARGANPPFMFLRIMVIAERDGDDDGGGDHHLVT